MFDDFDMMVTCEEAYNEDTDWVDFLETEDPLLAELIEAM